jgi:hypothetical protein
MRSCQRDMVDKTNERTFCSCIRRLGLYTNISGMLITEKAITMRRNALGYLPLVFWFWDDAYSATRPEILLTPLYLSPSSSLALFESSSPRMHIHLTDVSTRTPIAVPFLHGMCIRVIEKFPVCGCVYHTHSVDQCAYYGRHPVVDRVIWVGASCQRHGS